MSQAALAPSQPAADALRARELRRMRLIAAGLLVVMAIVFALAAAFQSRWPALAYLRAFAEAGMVGGFADWFAVTALFRRPLGLPIPHTAIIPRNKERIGQALGRFIAENFLTEAVLQERLRAIEVAQWGGAWLRRPANARRLAERLAVVLPAVLGAAPKGMLGELARAALLAGARAMPAAATGGRVLAALQREGRGEALLDQALERLAQAIGENREVIRRQIVDRSQGWFGRLVDGLVVGRVIEGLVKLLEEMRAPDHRLRRMLRVGLRNGVRRLRTDPQLQQRAEELKAMVLAHPTLSAALDELQEALDGPMLRAILADRRALAARLEGAVRALGAWLAEDGRSRERLNAWARELAVGVIAPRRDEIGRFVAEVVAGWEAQSVTEKLELQVGRDLQYIRINGALVGGLVGLAIFALARAAGLG